MKTNLKATSRILMMLIVALLTVIQCGKLNAQVPLLHVRSEIQSQGKSSQANNGSHIILDGTLAGYDLRIIQSKLDKPCAQWYHAFIAAGWPIDQWRTARWVIFRESRCDQYAWNGQDAGLLQINKMHRPLVESYSLRFPDDLFNPETNLWIAFVLWSRYGWEPWEFRGIIPGK